MKWSKIMRLSALFFLFAASLLPLPGLTDDMRTETIRFEPGASGTSINGKITGYETVDYLLGARAGQTLKIDMQTGNTAAYFNVIPPDSESEADFIGSTEGYTYSGTLDLDGDWKIRVYMMRSAARRNEQASYTLDVGITGKPDPEAARQANDFGPRDWDARGALNCAMSGQQIKEAGCPFKVIRYLTDNGATVFALRPGTDAVRLLYYQNGEWSTDSSAVVKASKSSDIWTLTVEGETYDVPDAVVLGG